MALAIYSPATQADYALCRDIMHRASKNYTAASYMLPKEKLPHVEALYAVLRVGDDRVDVSHEGFSSAREAIEDWQEHYFRAYQKGDSPYGVMRAYLNTSQQFNISPDILKPYFRAMIEDLNIRHYETFADLVHYMEGSAMPVGRAMAHILGTYTPQVSDVYPEADALSIAMQLSNFWRDIGQDLQIGRIYIPLEDMARYGYNRKDLAEHKITQNFIELLNFEFARTEEFYKRARTGVAWLASGQWGVMSALEIYRAIMSSIRQNNYDVFGKRAETMKSQKARLVARARFSSYWGNIKRPALSKRPLADAWLP